MPAGFAQALKATIETTYGVPNAGTSLVEGTDFLYLRLPGDNAFTMRRAPAYYGIRSADSGNRRIETGTARYDLAGTLSSLPYPTQMAFLLNAAAGLTGTAPDLPSYTLDFYDTVKTHRFTGCKVKKLGLTFGADGQVGALSVDWVGQQDITSPPALALPAVSHFPTVKAYTLQDSQGLVSLGGVSFDPSDFSLTITNMLAPAWGSRAYISNLYYAGRDLDLSIKAQYLTTALRDAYEAGTVQAGCTCKWIKGPSGSPTNSLTFTFNDAYVKSVADTLPLGNASYQEGGLEVYADSTTGADFTFAVV